MARDCRTCGWAAEPRPLGQVIQIACRKEVPVDLPSVWQKRIAEVHASGNIFAVCHNQGEFITDCPAWKPKPGGCPVCGTHYQQPEVVEYYIGPPPSTKVCRRCFADDLKRICRKYQPGPVEDIGQEWG